MGWTDNPSHYRLLCQIRSPAHSSPLILISELVITGQLLAAPILWRYSEQSARPLTSIVTFVRVMSSCLQMVILLLHPLYCQIPLTPLFLIGGDHLLQTLEEDWVTGLRNAGNVYCQS